MTGRKVGAYRLRRELGQGAFGRVYEADEEFDGHAFARVAVKIIEPRDVSHRAAILSELATLANFRHPAIVGYRAFGELPPPASGALAPVYIALELAEGGTLGDVYRRELLAPRALLELAREVAGGLALLAARGWTHRDIKPDNLLRFDAATDGEARGVWKISDLGLARPLNAPEETRAVAGTRRFLAPEAWAGVVSPAADVWALGLCLREAATGEKLWSNIPPAALASAIGHDPAPLDVSAVPPLLRPLVAGCLERDPAKRWSAAQVSEYARLELDRLDALAPSDLVVAPGGEGTHTSLGAAIAGAAPSAHITIWPGTYRESLVLDRDVHLVGLAPAGGDARALVVIESDAAPVLNITGGHATLENLTLRALTNQSRRLGAPAPAVAVGEAQARFVNCGITSATGAGVVAQSGARLRLEGCRMQAANEGMVALERSRVALEGGQVWGCGGDGLVARSGARLEARGATVARCGGYGIRLAPHAVAFLLRCRLSGNARHGVRAESTTLARLENCDARGNAFGAWEIPVGTEVTRVGNSPA